jgi:hypothetical protein
MSLNVWKPPIGGMPSRPKQPGWPTWLVVLVSVLALSVVTGFVVCLSGCSSADKALDTDAQMYYGSRRIDNVESVSVRFKGTDYEFAPADVYVTVDEAGSVQRCDVVREADGGDRVSIDTFNRPQAVSVVKNAEHTEFGGVPK